MNEGVVKSTIDDDDEFVSVSNHARIIKSEKVITEEEGEREKSVPSLKTNLRSIVSFTNCILSTPQQQIFSS